MAFEPSFKHTKAAHDSLPDNLAESATAEALCAICEIDLSELEAVELPRGFGRDGRSSSGFKASMTVPGQAVLGNQWH